MKFILKLIFLIGLATLAFTACPNTNNYLGSTLPPTNGTYQLYTWGIDVFSANQLTSNVISCLEGTGTYSTIGLYIGLNKIGPVAIDPTQYSSEVIQAWLSGSFNRELIVNVNLNLKDPFETITGILAPFVEYSGKINQIWIRPNMDPDCPPQTAYVNCQTNLTNDQNVNLLNQIVLFVKGLGFSKVGIYSSVFIWGRWFDEGGDQTFGNLAGLPLMFDDVDFSDLEPNFGDYEVFGPWKSPAAKMSGYWYLDPVCCWPGGVGWQP